MTAFGRDRLAEGAKGFRVRPILLPVIPNPPPLGVSDIRIESRKHYFDSAILSPLLSCQHRRCSSSHIFRRGPAVSSNSISSSSVSASNDRVRWKSTSSQYLTRELTPACTTSDNLERAQGVTGTASHDKRSKIIDAMRIFFTNKALNVMLGFCLAGPNFRRTYPRKLLSTFPIMWFNWN